MEPLDQFMQAVSPNYRFWRRSHVITEEALQRALTDGGGGGHVFRGPDGGISKDQLNQLRACETDGSGPGWHRCRKDCAVSTFSLPSVDETNMASSLPTSF